jgi:hypothetical protein
VFCLTTESESSSFNISEIRHDAKAAIGKMLASKSEWVTIERGMKRVE